MPMIEAKVTVNLPEEKRNVLKAELGKAITIIGKPESYLVDDPPKIAGRYTCTLL